MIILFVGLPSIIVGTAVIFVEKTVKEKSSYITWHAASIYHLGSQKNPITFCLGFSFVATLLSCG